MARQSRNQGRKGFSPQRHRAHKDFHKIFSFCELRLRGYIPSLSSPRFAQAARLLMRSSTKKRRQVEINRKECKGADLELRQLIFASFAFSAVKSHPRIPSRTIQCRAKLATQCSVRGSKPRRRADTGVHRCPDLFILAAICVSLDGSRNESICRPYQGTTLSAALRSYSGW